MGIFAALLGHGSQVDRAALDKRLTGVLVDGESVEIAFQVIRDIFVFTNRRFIMIDVQGITGSKVDYTSIPFRSITAFSVETAGRFDYDAELKIWVSGRGQPFEKTLKKGTDVLGIQRALTLATTTETRA